MPQFVSFFEFINHFGKYMKIRNRYMKKCHFGGKIQIMMFFENVIKIAGESLKVLTESIIMH